VVRLLRIRFLFVFLALLGAATCRAEPWQRDPILSQLLVRTLLTDPAGFQWIATDEGVYRYDGYELVPLARLVRAGSVAAPKGLCSAFSLDPAGHLWIGTDMGVFRLTLRTGALRRVALPHDAGFPQPTITQLYRHPRSGHLWVSCGDGSTVVLDIAHGARLISRRRLPGVGFIYVPDGSPAGVWISFIDLHFFDPTTQRERLSQPGVVRVGPTGPIHRFLPITGLADPTRGFVPTDVVMMPVPGTHPLQLFSPNALYEVSPEGKLREVKRWLPPGRNDNFLPAYCHSDSACEWISQHQYVQLTVRGPRTGEFLTDSTHLGEVPHFYRHNFVVYRDGRGVQWCYSRTWRGVYKRRTAAPRAVRPLLQTGGRPLPSVRGISRLADGRLLVGTYGESFVQAADSPRAPLRGMPFARPLRLGVVAYDMVTMHRPPFATLVLEEDLGFSVVDPQTHRSQFLTIDPGERHRPARFLTLLEDAQGRIWSGTDSGLFQLDAPRMLARRYRPPHPNPSVAPLRRLRILDIAADSVTGHLWLATPQGLYRLAPATGELRRIGIAPARPLPTDDLLCVAAAGRGRAWVGTRTEGLLLVDPQRGLVQQLSLSEGLPSSTVATVLCRADGAVWAGTYAGLIRYDPAQQRLAVFGPTAGLNEPEMNRNAAYADPRTGTLLFGGVGGLYQVSPTTMGQDEHDRQRAIRLLVTAWTEGNDRRSTDPPPVPQPLLAGASVPALRLGAQPTDFVELRLALTDLLTPDFTHYAYRLRSASAGAAPLPMWQPTTRRLVLQGLAAGDYTVEIRAETSTGQSAANLVRIPLRVARVWWMHPAVWVLAALALVGLTYGLFWLQGRRARREARLRDELAANLHDDVGGLLTKISLMAEVLQHPEDMAPDDGDDYTPNAPDEPTARQLATRLLLNSRAAVQALRDVVWSIDSRADSVQALLDRMEDHLDQTAPAAGLLHSFEADPLAHLQALRPLVRKHVYLVFKEAVTNTVRHAKGATTLHVRLVREGSYFVLEVTDDGQPTAAVSRTGMGLRSMGNRAQAINGILRTGPRAPGQPGYQVQLRVKA
jgi:signal transduction histidine kinase